MIDASLAVSGARYVLTRSFGDAPGASDRRPRPRRSARPCGMCSSKCRPGRGAGDCPRAASMPDGRLLVRCRVIGRRRGDGEVGAGRDFYVWRVASEAGGLARFAGTESEVAVRPAQHRGDAGVGVDPPVPASSSSGPVGAPDSRGCGPGERGSDGSSPTGTSVPKRGCSTAAGRSRWPRETPSLRGRRAPYGRQGSHRGRCPGHAGGPGHGVPESVACVLLQRGWVVQVFIRPRPGCGAAVDAAEQDGASNDVTKNGPRHSVPPLVVIRRARRASKQVTRNRTLAARPCSTPRARLRASIVTNDVDWSSGE